MYGMHVFGTERSTACPATNLALGMAAVASSYESTAFPPSSAFDGSASTRWSSKFTDPQYIYVDLGTSYSLCNVTLTWESAYGVDFTIDGSLDTLTWRNLATFTGNSAKNNIVSVSGNARYVRMRGTRRATGYGYSLYEFVVHGGIILPVKLHDFDAYLTGGKYVELRWDTDAEQSNDHFVIERSHDGAVFHPIGTVKGGNSSSTSLSYEYIDDAPYPGVSYYRLNQVDIDGKSVYSDVVSIHLNDMEHNVMVYPNPATENINIRAAAGDNILDAQLFDIRGTELVNEALVSESYLNMQLDRFPPGMYMLRVDTQKGGRQFFRVVKE